MKVQANYTDHEDEESSSKIQGSIEISASSDLHMTSTQDFSKGKTSVKVKDDLSQYSNFERAILSCLPVGPGTNFSRRYKQIKFCIIYTFLVVAALIIFIIVTDFRKDYYNEQKLIGIFQWKPTHVDDIAVKTWLLLGPFKLANLISNYQITFDGAIDVQILKQDNLLYTGQLDSYVSAHGIGRCQGEWGLYEGKFIHGSANGYGRLISGANVYEGQFKAGMLHGSGTYNGMKGIWDHGQHGGKIYQKVPLLMRKVTDFERNLEQIMGTNDGFDLIQGLNQQQLILDDQFELGEFQLSVLGIPSTYKGQMKGNVAHGIGRLENTKGKYVGQISDGYFNGFGKFIDGQKNSFTGNFKDGQTTITGNLSLKKGVHLKYMEMTKDDRSKSWIQYKSQEEDPILRKFEIMRYQSPLELDLIKLFDKKTESKNFKNSYKIDLEINKNILKLGAEDYGILLNPNFQYEGQLDDAVSATGLGRVTGKWGMYQGQMVNGWANGYGQYADADNVFRGQWTDGKFKGIKVPRVLRKKSQLENYLQNIFQKSSKWAEFKLSDHMNNGHLSIDETLPIGQIEKANGVKYNGQVGKKGSLRRLESQYAHGIGQVLVGEDSVYSGQFENGYATGFGMFINQNENYTGQFSSGLFQGEGRYFSQTDNLVGEWECGNLKASQFQSDISVEQVGEGPETFTKMKCAKEEEVAEEKEAEKKVEEEKVTEETKTEETANSSEDETKSEIKSEKDEAKGETQKEPIAKEDQTQEQEPKEETKDDTTQKKPIVKEDQTQKLDPQEAQPLKDETKKSEVETKKSEVEPETQDVKKEEESQIEKSMETENQSEEVKTQEKTPKDEAEIEKETQDENINEENKSLDQNTEAESSVKIETGAKSVTKPDESKQEEPKEAKQDTQKPQEDQLSKTETKVKPKEDDEASPQASPIKDDTDSKSEVKPEYESKQTQVVKEEQPSKDEPSEDTTPKETTPEDTTPEEKTINKPEDQPETEPVVDPSPKDETPKEELPIEETPKDENNTPPQEEDTQKSKVEPDESKAETIVKPKEGSTEMAKKAEPEVKSSEVQPNEVPEEDLTIVKEPSEDEPSKDEVKTSEKTTKIPEVEPETEPVVEPVEDETSMDKESPKDVTSKNEAKAPKSVANPESQSSDESKKEETPSKEPKIEPETPTEDNVDKN